MKLASRLGAALLAAAAALAAPASAQTPEQVTVATTATLTGGLPKVVEALGLFEAHGLEARLVQAFEERPDAVKAAILATFPAIDQAMVDTFYDIELAGFAARPLTAEDMAREIAFVKAAGANLPGLDEVDPAGMLYP